MPLRSDGTEVPQATALQEWVDAAYQQLKDVATEYNQVISYKALALHIQDTTGIATKQLIMNWIGKVLEIVAQRAADAKEPPLTSLCTHADGTIGDGYDRAPKFAPPSTTSDIEEVAAEHRLLCYRRYATRLPEDGGTPTLTPEVQIQRRKATSGESDSAWLQELMKSGTLSAHDRVPFESHVQVARLFGRDYKGHQSATIRLNETTQVWFPKMYANSDWDNSLSDAGSVITMRPVAGGKYVAVMESKPLREYVITFGHRKSPSGFRHYEFLGVFETVHSRSDTTQWVHQRVAETIRFDGNGDFSFDPVRPHQSQDDQAAEAADTNPKLVDEFQLRLTAGSYAVEDQVGESKVRGSAQAVFANAVKGNYGWECAVTGITTRAFLVASHIVPWSADKEIRLDPSNGICLSTFVDRAFDAGYLTITPQGRTSVRWERVKNDPILKHELSRIDDVEITRPSAAPPDPDKLRRRVELGF
ncbi:HNH endonuclease [Microbacterium wangruii]|uniref:HNH endonuclease n=1 Tax=Microbacterium wangruii TaxID=3049073 RepID=UPI00256F3587|nr:HNH endonuclease [Microbacterium sp. zg-Y1211]MDL5486016.1 HNH endonuclease [Microbacterium sp. zg-Y1211]